MHITVEQFDANRLLRAILDIDDPLSVSQCGWRRDCEIVSHNGRLIVRHVPTGQGLRWSAGVRQGYFWDIYGDDCQRPEWALVALSHAPPPCGIDPRGEARR